MAGWSTPSRGSIRRSRSHALGRRVRRRITLSGVEHWDSIRSADAGLALPASVLDLALQQFDFVGSQVEELVDAVVDLGFGGGELLG